MIDESWEHIQSLDWPDREFHEKAYKHFKAWKKDKEKGKELKNV